MKKMIAIYNILGFDFRRLFGFGECGEIIYMSRNDRVRDCTSTKYYYYDMDVFAKLRKLQKEQNRLIHSLRPVQESQNDKRTK